MSGWRDDAACRPGNLRGYDPEWWFPVDSDQATERVALRICREECPVRGACLKDARGTYGGAAGIWGGTTEEERRRVRRQGHAGRLARVPA